MDAYDDPTAQNDLNKFDTTFGLSPLPACTSATQTGCFEKYKMTSNLKSNGGWVFEESLDIEWSHAIAPSARILLVEANSEKGKDLINAVAYAKARSDVVAVSMSWGYNDAVKENMYDSFFTANHAISFFTASGDSGAGAEWPAVSTQVVSVGGTSLNFVNGQFSS